MRHSDMAQASNNLAKQNQILKNTLIQACRVIETGIIGSDCESVRFDAKTVLDKCVVIGLIPDDYLDGD